jgi:hypothetical protein
VVLAVVALVKLEVLGLLVVQPLPHKALLVVVILVLQIMLLVVAEALAQ